MLDVPGSTYRFCDGISRRDFLRVGGLGSVGLALPELFRQRAGAAAKQSAPGGSSKAKSCILVFLLGGPPQQETFDLKPDAPAEVRGPFKPIATNVPGIQICEHLPLLARHADKYTLVRSAFNNGGVSDTHTDATYLALTGHRWPQVQNDGSRARPDHHPCMGSAVSYLRPGMNGLPASVHFPELMRADLGAIGQGAGFLGKKYDPFRLLPKNVANPRPEDLDYRVEALSRQRDDSSKRLDQRRELLSQVSRQTAPLFRSSAGTQMDSHYEKAFDMLGSAQVRQAFDLTAEPEKMRTRYRKDIFGQGALLARRLVEHGVSLVTVLWSGSETDGGWDLHYQVENRAKVLLPILDQGLSALLEDLSTRGMLDETLVVCMGEFGRAPRVEDKGGRGHWGSCYSVLLAGGGIRGGQVYGVSDSRAAYPRSNGVGTSDIVATIYHCLGIDSDTEITDQLGRPMKLCQGSAVQPLLA